MNFLRNYHFSQRVGMHFGLLLAIAALCAGIAACGDPDRWEGFVYPDRTNMTKHHTTGTHPTLDDCRASAVSMLRALDSDTLRGDYECGLNCRSEAGLGTLKICKETGQ